MIPPTLDAKGISEYLSQNLGFFINKRGDLWNTGDVAQCEMSIDEAATRTCPDWGKLEFKINPREYYLMWDNAPSHLSTKQS